MAADIIEGETDFLSPITTALRAFRFLAAILWRMITSEMGSAFQCAGCGEWNHIKVDESAGRRQSYIEDCQVCCRPNVLHIEYDPAEQRFVIVAELE